MADERLTWDFGSISNSAALSVAVEQMANITGAYHRKLINHGLTRDEATQLTKVFIAGVLQAGAQRRQG